MKTALRRNAFLSIVFLACLATAWAEKPVELRLKWPLGARLVYRMEIMRITETPLPTAPPPMPDEMTMTHDFALSPRKEREDGGREIELEFIACKIDVKRGGDPVLAFDSRSPEGKASPMTAIFRPMIGAKLKYLTRPDGTVEKVEGVQELLEKMTGGMPETVDTLVVKEIFDYAQSAPIMLNAQLPTKPVGVGESWPASGSMPLGSRGAINFESTVTLTGWEERNARKCAVLKEEGSFRHTVGGPPDSGDIQIEIDCKANGTLWFDPALGALVESVVTHDFVDTTKVPGITVDLRTKIAQTIKMKLVEAGR